MYVPLDECIVKESKRQIILCKELKLFISPIAKFFHLCFAVNESEFIGINVTKYMLLASFIYKYDWVINN